MENSAKLLLIIADSSALSSTISFPLPEQKLLLYLRLMVSENPDKITWPLDASLLKSLKKHLTSGTSCDRDTTQNMRYHKFTGNILSCAELLSIELTKSMTGFFHKGQ